MHRACSVLSLVVSLTGCPPAGEGVNDSATDAAETSTSATTGTTDPATSSTTTSDPVDPTSTTAAPGTTGTSTTIATTSAGEDASSSTGSEPPPSICGDGLIEGDELCDDGAANGDDQACTSACAPAECGDGLVWAGHEACDLGVDNSNDGACTKACEKAHCGDGLTHVGVEECDEGQNNNATKYGGCIPETCKLGPHCGDGTAQLDDEECDDADDDLDETLASCKACSWESKLVFVTSGHYNGKFGGLAGADTLCKSLAEDAGLDNSPFFKAWLSDGTKSPSSQMTMSDVPYSLVSGVKVADSWDDLVDGALKNPISADESGQPININDAVVWTSTATTGKPAAQAIHCSSWSSDSWSATARVGNAMKIDKAWTDADTKECDSFARLYCIEQ